LFVVVVVFDVLLFLMCCCFCCCFDLALVDMVFSLKLENEGKKMEIQWRWWTLVGGDV